MEGDTIGIEQVGGRVESRFNDWKAHSLTADFSYTVSQRAGWFDSSVALILLIISNNSPPIPMTPP